jgi:phosphatidylethanolamine/phosphatidyl-N-methylethanolamine N-methyltransferase
MNQPRTSKEEALFFKTWLRSPKSMGSVKPSSRALARAIGDLVAWKPGQTVVELGGGTGAITRGLIDSGIPRENLLVIELDGPMCEYLRRSLPGVEVAEDDVLRLTEILQERGIDDVGTVVSGLPMLNLSLDFQREVTRQSLDAVGPGGFMLQYSYSPLVPPIRHKTLGIEAKLERYVLYNLPPAAVWRFTRGRRDAEHARRS